MDCKNDEQPKELPNFIDLFGGNLRQISTVTCCVETQNEQKRFCVTAALGFDWSHVFAAVVRPRWPNQGKGEPSLNIPSCHSDPPEDGELGRLLQEAVHVVNHSGVELRHVHDLGQVGVFFQRQRGLDHTGVRLHTLSQHD